MVSHVRTALASAVFLSIVSVPSLAVTEGFSHTLAVSDEELDEARGGFVLPNGIEISMAVQTDTRLNGELLLRSVMVINTGAPSIQIYVPTAIPSNAATSAQTSVSQPGTRAIPTYQPPASVNVSVANTPTTTAVALAYATDNLTQLPVVVGGPAVDTDNGKIVAVASPNGVRVSFAGDQLNVQNLLGQSIGNIITNTANNRVIDTSTTINIDLKNATANLVGSSILRTADLAIDAARQGSH